MPDHTPTPVEPPAAKRITSVVPDLLAILNSADASEDEKSAAASTIVEAIAPDIMEMATRDLRAEWGNPIEPPAVKELPGLRIVPVKLWNKHSLELLVNGEWREFHTDYLCHVERMKEKLLAWRKSPAPGELERLRVENAKLLAAIKEHHEQKADDRCWMDDAKLYAAAGLDSPPFHIHIGDPDAMLANCKRFIAQRCNAGGPWKSYAELEQQLTAAIADKERAERENANAKRLDSLHSEIIGNIERLLGIEPLSQTKSICGEIEQLQQRLDLAGGENSAAELLAACEALLRTRPSPVYPDEIRADNAGRAAVAKARKQTDLASGPKNASIVEQSASLR